MMLHNRLVKGAGSLFQPGRLTSADYVRAPSSESLALLPGETPHGANPIPWRLRPASFRTSMLRRWASIQSTRNLDLAAVSSHVLWCNDVGGISTCKVILRISYNAVGSELALRNFHGRPSIEIEHTADSLTQRMLVSGRNRRLELAAIPGAMKSAMQDLTDLGSRAKASNAKARCEAATHHMKCAKTHIAWQPRRYLHQP